jgi:NAD(P)-dependent dehydrogenase (short-subunit alcohol dehydrogenase family)
MQRVALVTGSSRGIGAAIARRLASAGYAVCVNAREDMVAAEALAEALRRDGARCAAVQADATCAEDIARLFAAVDAQLGPLHLLVNNAAILRPQARLEAMSAERMAEVLRANVLGPLLCCQQAVRRLSTRHGGSGGVIVNISSLAARTGAPGEYIDYAAAKGAIDTLTRGLAREVAGEGIRVNAVRPALIRTGMHAAGGEPERVERWLSRIPLGRAGLPEDVAEAVYYLASDAAAFVTGQLLDVAGGL